MRWVLWPPLIAAGKPRGGSRGESIPPSEPRSAPTGVFRPPTTTRPLYTFVKDTKLGDRQSGEEIDAFGAEWYAVTAAGAKVEKADATSSDGSSYPAAGGYGPAY